MSTMERNSRTRRAPGAGAAHRTTAGVGLALGALLLVGSAPGEAQERDFEWSGALDAGRTLEVKGVNGDVRALPARDGEARVRAVKRWDDSDPDAVRIEVVEHDDGVTICAVYPHRRTENRCEPGDAGGMSVEDNDVRVDFTVEVPASARFRGRTVNGEVEVDDVEADVDVGTVNGNVEITTAGVARARTVNGSIDARMGRSPTGPLAFSTVNGSIDLDVPDGLGAELDARWVNGGLESELPVSLVGRLSRHRARGRLGDGGPLLEMKTVNGSIRIR